MELEELIKKITGVFEKLDIPYVITGGIAVTVWGHPRFTADIDIGIDLVASKLDRFAKELLKVGKDAYVDMNMMQRAFERHGEFNFIHPDSAMKVDFFVLKKNPFDREEMKRRVSRMFLGNKTYFISPEDLILRKLMWYEEGGSTRQLEDIKSVLKRQKKLDWRYLAKWSKKQGTAKMLMELRKQVKSPHHPERKRG